MSRLATLADLVDLYRARGNATYGEDVTQIAHAEQTAAHVAAVGGSPAAIAAALLHDIGHLLVPDDPAVGDDRHESFGAHALGLLFSTAVRHPIALHVAAKRYLCATDPGYFAALSAESRRSLTRQGGPFTPDAAAHFARRPYAAAAVALRRADDAGKQPGGVAPPFASYLPLLATVAHRS